MKEVELAFLKEELSTNKKYILHKPFIIFISGFAAIKFIGVEYIALIPFLVISYIAFVLWFNLNRMESSSRIVAYMAEFLERSTPYFGWQRYLSLHRDAAVKSEIDIREIEEKARMKITSGRARYFKGINICYTLMSLFFLLMSWMICANAYCPCFISVVHSAKINTPLSLIFALLSLVAFIKHIQILLKGYRKNEPLTFERERLLAVEIRKYIEKYKLFDHGENVN